MDFLFGDTGDGKYGMPLDYGNRKILLYDGERKTAKLIEIDGTAKPMEFANAHAALDWAFENDAVFHYFPPRLNRN